MFSVFEAEALNNIWKWEIVSAVLIGGRWNWCFFGFWVGTSSFGCVAIVNGEMIKCQCHLIYDKANGDVATNSKIRMGWRLSTRGDGVNFRKSVKLML